MTNQRRFPKGPQLSVRLLFKENKLANYVALVEAKPENLTRHSLIAKSQFQYLKSRKQQLEAQRHLGIILQIQANA